MKYLQEFYNYLKESDSNIVDLSKEDIEEMLLPISDMGIEWDMSEPKVLTTGEFSGQKSVSIRFKNDFETGDFGYYTQQIIDDKFWSFLNELLELKLRLESAKVSINTNWQNYIVMTFVQKSKVEGPEFTLQKLFNEIGKKMREGRSDFINNMTREISIQDKKITLAVSHDWTDRKWNLFKRDLDLSKFDVSIQREEKRLGMNSGVVTFTLKK